MDIEDQDAVVYVETEGDEPPAQDAEEPAAEEVGEVPRSTKKRGREGKGWPQGAERGQGVQWLPAVLLEGGDAERQRLLRTLQEGGEQHLQRCSQAGRGGVVPSHDVERRIPQTHPAALPSRHLLTLVGNGMHVFSVGSVLLQAVAWTLELRAQCNS